MNWENAKIEREKLGKEGGREGKREREREKPLECLFDPPMEGGRERV